MTHKSIQLVETLNDEDYQSEIDVQPFSDGIDDFVMIASNLRCGGKMCVDSKGKVVDERICIPVKMLDAVIKAAVEIREYMKTKDWEDDKTEE